MDSSLLYSKESDIKNKQENRQGQDMTPVEECDRQTDGLTDGKVTVMCQPAYAHETT